MEQMLDSENLTLALHIGNIINMHHAGSPDIAEIDDNIVSRFIALLDNFGNKEHSVYFYAAKLGISTKQLSGTLAGIRGKTAKKWIDENLVFRAKNLLLNSQISIQEVADILNFPDHSAFSKFFKRHAGVNPIRYRKIHLK